MCSSIHWATILKVWHNLILSTEFFLDKLNELEGNEYNELYNKARTKVVHKNISQGYYKVKLVPIRSNSKKKDMCCLRYTSETIFSRVTSLGIMKDVVSYQNLEIISICVGVGFCKVKFSCILIRLLQHHDNELDMTLN